MDDERLLPTGLVDVGSTDLDFRTRRSLRGLAVDHAYTGLRATDCVDTATAIAWAPEGTGVAMRWSVADLPWVQVHTADRPHSADDRVGLAVEPMTCPPDALNSGTDLVVLQPGGSRAATCQIEALASWPAARSSARRQHDLITNDRRRVFDLPTALWCSLIAFVGLTVHRTR